MNSSFPNRWSFSYLKFTKYVINMIAETKYEYGQQEQVKVRNHNRSTALERSVLKYWGGLNRFDGYPSSPSASVVAQNIQLFGPHDGFLTHRWIITGNKQIADKYYDETEMRTWQKRIATDTWRSLVCRATHWNTGAKENQQLNPQFTST